MTISKHRSPNGIASGAEFHENYASGWADRYARRTFLQRRRFICNLLSAHVRPNQRWLDAGCGAGVLTVDLANLGAWGVAIDGSPAMIEAAKLYFDGIAERFDFRVVSKIEQTSLPSLSFDGVLLSSVIEYVENPLSLLTELHRVTKPGGVLIVSAPNSRSLLRRLQKRSRTALATLGVDTLPYLDYSKHDFSASALKNLLFHSGFLTAELFGFSPSIFGRPIAPRNPALYFAVARR